jgi:hypothetical protein
MWPRDLPGYESGTADRACGGGWRVPAFWGNQGLRAARLRLRTVDGAPNLASGEKQGATVRGGRHPHSRWRGYSSVTPPTWLPLSDTGHPPPDNQSDRMAPLAAEQQRGRRTTTACVHAVAAAARICWTPRRELTSVCRRVAGCSTSAGAPRTPPLLLRLTKQSCYSRESGRCWV